MGMRIFTNIASLNAQRRLVKSTERNLQYTTRLATGLRINRAGEDAAGLSVSENLRADVRSLAVARRNALDGVSLVQTAEGGLMETSNILVRLRQLAVQASSDTVGDNERGYLDLEYQHLKAEINRIAVATEFNGTRLLVGKYPPIPDEIKTGENEAPFEVQVYKDYLPQSDHIDSDSQVNIIKLDLGEFSGFATGERSLHLDISTQGETLFGIGHKSMALRSISRIDDALVNVNEQRAALGAIQRHLYHATQSLGINIENLDLARSRIRDADYATETSNYMKEAILQKAGTSVLASANVHPEVALSLLSPSVPFDMRGIGASVRG